MWLLFCPGGPATPAGSVAFRHPVARGLAFSGGWWCLVPIRSNCLFFRFFPRSPPFRLGVRIVQNAFGMRIPKKPNDIRAVSSAICRRVGVGCHFSQRSFVWTTRGLQKCHDPKSMPYYDLRGRKTESPNPLRDAHDSGFLVPLSPGQQRTPYPFYGCGRYYVRVEFIVRILRLLSYAGP